MNRERRQKIANIVLQNGSIKNEDIMERFNVSIETVRRDLAFLEKQGVIERVYGGAVKKSYYQTEPAYALRESKNSIEKKAIALKAEKFITESDVVYFDIGTTVLALANVLSANKKITAFTNAIRTALTLTDKCAQVIIPGGKIRPKELAVSGALAIDNIKEFNIEKAFVGVAGIDANGVTDFIEDEARIRRAIIENAKKVIVLADYTKFSVRAVCNVCPLSKIDVVITDSKADKKVIEQIKAQGVEVIIA